MNFRYLLVLIAALLAIVWIRTASNRHRIVSAHVINMDESVDRLRDFQTRAAEAGLDVIRWAGVNGAKLTLTEAEAKGIPREIFETYEQEKGVLGCYLAHKTLLEKLCAMNCNPMDVHLIFEDDALIPADFRQKWETTCGLLPSNWEGIHLGVSRPRVRYYRGHMNVASGENGNWGTFAYAIRHGALHKICKDLATMRGPVDVHFQQKMSVWRWFICYPEVVPHDYEYKSNTTGHFYDAKDILASKILKPSL